MSTFEPARVLGRLGAMRTFSENFPMNILDVRVGGTYTSIFKFLIDVLAECNVPIYDIINRLISKVYGINTKIEGGINTIYESISNIDIDEQSAFFKTMETGIKSILMALLTSIFSCSAVPVIPTKYMDFSSNGRPSASDGGDESIRIQKNMLNMFGHFDVNPFSDEGKLYFSVNGGDKYYHLEKRTEIIEYEANTIEVPSADVCAYCYVSFGDGHEEYEGEYGIYREDEYVFRISDPVDEDIVIRIRYKDSNGVENNIVKTIEAGKLKSEVFFISPDQNESIIDLGFDNAGAIVSNKTLHDQIYVYLSKSASIRPINYWKSDGDDSLDKHTRWGDGDIPTKTITIEEAYSENIDLYEYREVGGPIEGAERMNAVPETPNENDAEYIVVYDGVDPTTAYKSSDMNAFMWYVYNMGMYEPQIELNKGMWDSRRAAIEHGVERRSPSQWNAWYNSKTNSTGQFNYSGYDNDGNLYPIVQLYRYGDYLEVKFPAQRYYKPRLNSGDSAFVRNFLRMNATIYRFNYDYLQSIRIFNPRTMLYGMFDSLLNGAISEMLNIRPSINRVETDWMLSTAIKRYIESEDAEVEDCFFRFSNEEFDNMLTDMLLSRYGVTVGGEGHISAIKHDLEDYLRQINSINLSASADGETTKITKLITDVSVTTGIEGEIDRKLAIGYDEGWWKRIIWAIALPIVKSIFTPQVILLFLINFRMMGILSSEDLFSTDQTKIMRIFTNKIFSTVRSIISYIKDELALILFEFFVEKVMPLIAECKLISLREKLESWSELLKEALSRVPIPCGSLSIPIPRRKFELSAIDDVNYADIVKEQNTPESLGGC